MGGETEHAELKSAKRQLGSLNYFGPLAVAVWVTACMVYVARTDGPPPATVDGWQAVWGQFGDFMGGVVNPVVSLLALLALLATFRVQVGELEIASREMKNSADALKAQNQVLAEQVRHTKRQDRLAGIERSASLISSSIDKLLEEKVLGGLTTYVTLADQLDQLAEMDVETDRPVLNGKLQEIRRLTDKLKQLLGDLAWFVQEYKNNEGAPVVPVFYVRRYRRLLAAFSKLGLLDPEVKTNFFGRGA